MAPTLRRLGLYWLADPKNYVAAETVVEFLRELLKHLRGRVIVVWDGGSNHKGSLIRAFCTRQDQDQASRQGAGGGEPVRSRVARLLRRQESVPWFGLHRPKGCGPSVRLKDRLRLHGGASHGLSRMRGNSHVRFLGEGAAAMPPPYPTPHCKRHNELLVSGLIFDAPTAAGIYSVIRVRLGPKKISKSESDLPGV